jgi:FkbM family methyltransferase
MINLRLVHILNRLDGDREIQSINSLSKLKNYGVDYIQQLTPLYDGTENLLPTSSGLIHDKGHYGLYQSYKKAILNNFSEDLDALIICECDCILNISHDIFMEEISKTLDFCKKYNIYQFTWGSRIIDGIEQNEIIKTDENYPNYCIVTKIVQTHFIILTKQSRNFYLDSINDIKWDAVDIWLNELVWPARNKPMMIKLMKVIGMSSFSGRFCRQGGVFNEIAYQCEGISLLDNIVKGKQKNLKIHMKNKFYVHDSKNELVDLGQDSQILFGDWGKRFEVKYLETMTYHEIYNREDYFKGDCRILPGDVVVDCGGNIGIFTSLAFDMGASRVLSFEPYPDNFELDKKNNPSAEIFNLAVTNKSDDSIEVLYTPTTSGGHTIIQSELQREKPGHFEHKNVFVKTITLDDIISRNFIDHIDFLKVDTEGSELMILEGLSNENLSKIRCISLEYHNAVFNYDEQIYSDFQLRFNKLGFNTFTWILDRYTRMLYVCRGDVFKDNPNHSI